MPRKVFLSTAATLMVFTFGIHLLLIQGISQILVTSLTTIFLVVTGLLPNKKMSFIIRYLDFRLTIAQVALLFVAVFRVHREGSLDILFLNFIAFTFTLISAYKIKKIANSLKILEKGRLAVVTILSVISIPYLDVGLGISCAVVISFLSLPKKNLILTFLLGGTLFISTLLNERTYSDFLLHRLWGRDANFHLTYLTSSFGNLDFIVRSEIKNPEVVFEISGTLELKKTELYFRNSKLRQNISSLRYKAIGNFIKTLNQQSKKCLILSSEIGQLTAELTNACQSIDIVPTSSSQQNIQKNYGLHLSKNLFTKVTWLAFFSINENSLRNYDLVFWDCFDFEKENFIDTPNTVFYCTHPIPKSLRNILNTRTVFSSSFQDFLYIPKTFLHLKKESHFYQEVAPISE